MPSLPGRSAPALFLILFVISAVLSACLTPLVTPNAPRPTAAPTTAVPQPIVQAFPSAITPGMSVAVLGLNFKPDEQLVFYLRDASHPTEPILQIGSTRASPQGMVEWSFIYPSAAPWASITNASVIVQSLATTAYFTTNLTVASAGFLTPTIVTSTQAPPTIGAVVVPPPLTGAVDTTPQVAAPAPQPAAAALPPCSPRSDWPTYVVESGDTLLRISQTTGTTVEALKQANCFSSDVISVGQRLFVPSLRPTSIAPLMVAPWKYPPLTPTPIAPLQPPPPPALCSPRSDWQIYIVKSGNTLYSISKAAGITVAELKRANCLSSDVIDVSQQLFVPRLPPTPIVQTRVPPAP
jgi:LysM repeat protein